LFLQTAIHNMYVSRAHRDSYMPPVLSTTFMHKKFLPFDADLPTHPSPSQTFTFTFFPFLCLHLKQGHTKGLHGHLAYTLWPFLNTVDRRSFLHTSAGNRRPAILPSVPYSLPTLFSHSPKAEAYRKKVNNRKAN
jgi:hypothetical protein